MTNLVPSNGSEVRQIVEERLENQAELKDPVETTVVEWQGKQLALPVITVPVKLLKYNPNTHRIRVQKWLDVERNEELNKNPYGAQSQAYLHDLLQGIPSDPSKTDPAFKLLMDDLKQHGQTEPGIITREGVLINGNTRCAALRNLDESDIRVGVLPSHASFEDIEKIELSLQLRKSLKREYSFMNFLITVEEQIALGRPVKEILKTFRITQKTLDRSVWLLSFIREVIERSKVTTADGKTISLNLISFEEDQGKLEELYRAFTAQKAQSVKSADLLREQRLAALIMDKSKTDLRPIDADFGEKYMKTLTGNLRAAASGKDNFDVKVPGLKIKVAGPSPEVTNVREIVDGILQASAISKAAEKVSPKELEEAGKKLDTFGESLDRGLDLAGKHGRVTKKKYAPSDRMTEANESLSLALSAIAEAQAAGSFEAEDVEDQLLDMRQYMIQLAKYLTRGSY